MTDASTNNDPFLTNFRWFTELHIVSAEPFSVAAIVRNNEQLVIAWTGGNVLSSFSKPSCC